MLSKVIAFEGIDGCGKGTQVKLVNDRLTEMGYKTIILDFPRYDTIFGKRIGKLLSGEGYSMNDLDPFSAALWFAVDRASAFKDIDINDFDYVLLNRSTLSNAIYQSAKCSSVVLEGDVIEFIWKMEAELGIPRPDMFIIYDIDDKAFKSNIENRDKKEYLNDKEKDVYESDDDYMKKVQSLYRQARSHNSKDNINIINVSVDGNMLNKNIIASITMSIITEKLYQY